MDTWPIRFCRYVSSQISSLNSGERGVILSPPPLPFCPRLSVLSSSSSSSSRSFSVSLLQNDSSTLSSCTLSSRQLVYLFDEVSKRNSVIDKGAWNVYAEMAKNHINSMDIGDLCLLVRCLARVMFVKPSLLNMISKRVRLLVLSPDGNAINSPSSSIDKSGKDFGITCSILSSRQLSQLLLDFAKLGYLNPGIAYSLSHKFYSSSFLAHFRLFDLSLLLIAYSKIGLRERKLIQPVVDELQRRISIPISPHLNSILDTRNIIVNESPLDRSSSESSAAPPPFASFFPTQIVSIIYSLALLDYFCPLVETLLNSVYTRKIYDFSLRECVNLCFAVVVFEDFLTETSKIEGIDYGIALEKGKDIQDFMDCLIIRVAREGYVVESKKISLSIEERHQLQIVAAAYQGGSALFREHGFDDFVHDFLRLICEPMDHLMPPVECTKFQRSAENVLEDLGISRDWWQIEGIVGPYTIDYILPFKLALEMDGFKHYYLPCSSSSNEENDNPRSGGKNAPSIWRLRMKTRLKYRLLQTQALGNWKVATIPFFQWIHKSTVFRKQFLAEQIEKAMGMPFETYKKECKKLYAKK